MVDKNINSIGISSLVYFLVRGSFLGMGIYNIFQISTTNTAISSIIGAILGYIPLLIFLFIMKKGKGKNILEINKDLFGNKIGIIINFILSIMFLLFSVIIFYNLACFVDLQYMPETSKIYIKLLITIALIYALSKGIVSITRSAQIFLYITIGIFIVCALGLLNNLDVSNLFPIYNGSNIKIIISSFTYAIFSSMPLFLLGSIDSEIKDKNKYSKNIIIMYTFTNIMLVVTILFTILVMGYPLISVYKYPEYITTKKVILLNIFERIENTIAFQWIFDTFFLILMSIYFAFKNFVSYSKNKIYQKSLIYILPIICFLGTNVIFKNITESTIFNLKYTPYILASVVLISMSIILIKMGYNKIKNNFLE
ncbi:MAG: GerAB/ArcD/ProY family transporter [Clostridia bacterium]